MNWQNEVKLENALYLAIYADSVVCDRWSDTIKLREDRLLELRVFNDSEEFRAWRPVLGASFRTRSIGDTDPYFDEVHHLDIDSRYTVADGDRVCYRTTGGGSYALPGAYDRVRVRSYLKVGMNGLTYIYDWRIVGLIPAKSEVN